MKRARRIFIDFVATAASFSAIAPAYGIWWGFAAVSAVLIYGLLTFIDGLDA